MTWKAGTAQRLLGSLRDGLPQAAVIAVATADGDGPVVLRSENCPAGGRFEIGSIHQDDDRSGAGIPGG